MQTGGDWQKRFRHIRVWVLWAALALCTLTGCGGRDAAEGGPLQKAGAEGSLSQAEGSGIQAPWDGAEASERAFYQIRETVLPDPDLAMRNFMGEGDTLSETDIRLAGDAVYRLVYRWTEFGKSNETVSLSYLQILKPPYTEWESIYLPASCWDDEADDGVLISPAQRILDVKDGQVFLEIRHLGKVYRGVWDEEKGGRLLEEMEEGTCFFQADDQTLYRYQEKGSTYEWTTPEGAGESRQVKGQIYGFFTDPEDGSVCWYGTRQQGFGVWSVPEDKEIAFAAPQAGKASYALQDPVMAPDGAGGLCRADRHSLQQIGEGNQPETVCDFSERGYNLDEVTALEAWGEGLLVLTRFEGRRVLLQLEPHTSLGERQELVLAVTLLPRSGLSMLIDRFNRTFYDWYHVTVCTPGETESYEDFTQKVQLEISAGRGPDLFYGDVFGPETLAANGYLQSLDGVLEEGDYWQAALETGKIGGVLYGIPVEGSLYLTAYDERLIGERESITLPELTEALEGSSVKLLHPGFDLTDIVLYFGLFDDGNKTFIDWEKGESHLEGEAFAELLEFARQYEDAGQYSREEIVLLMEQGGVASVDAVPGGMDTMGDMNYLEACFEGHSSVIGYPKVTGNGIYLNTQRLYLSANSSKREAAEAFFRFLLSEESQDSYADYLASAQEIHPDEVFAAQDPHFPVRLSAIERMIQAKQAETGDEMTETYGVVYPAQGLSREGGDQIRFLVEHAESGDLPVYRIWEIIREELAVYARGERSAQETARILDRRVQLYLDENS